MDSDVTMRVKMMMRRKRMETRREKTGNSKKRETRQKKQPKKMQEEEEEIRTKAKWVVQMKMSTIPVYMLYRESGQYNRLGTSVYKYMDSRSHARARMSSVPLAKHERKKMTKQLEGTTELMRPTHVCAQVAINVHVRRWT
jgi:hypothetical protein